jgi:hypothetical protein
MINVRKGTAHSLSQTDFVGNLKTDENVVAGMLVRKDSSGDIVKVTTLTTAAESGLVGFALTNYNEGDAIESQKIGAYALDGGSVIETDQVTSSLTLGSNTQIGFAVVADGSTAGKVKVVAHGSVSTSRIIGTVYDAPRQIFVGQTAITVLPIKLGSAPATLT